MSRYKSYKKVVLNTKYSALRT